MGPVFLTRLKSSLLVAAALGAALYIFVDALHGASVETVEIQRSGADVFARNCARCHGADGRAQTPKGRQVDAADFTSNDWLPDTARDTRIVSNGKGSMPSFKRKLNAAEIGAVIIYIRRFKN